MNDQISKLRMSGIKASVLHVKVKGLQRDHDDTHKWADEEECMDIDIDFGHCEEKMLCDGYYHIVFAHPEALVSSKYGWELLLSETYQDNVAIGMDEAHCIVEW